MRKQNKSSSERRGLHIITLILLLGILVTLSSIWMTFLLLGDRSPFTPALQFILLAILGLCLIGLRVKRRSQYGYGAQPKHLRNEIRDFFSLSFIFFVIISAVLYYFLWDTVVLTLNQYVVLISLCLLAAFFWREGLTQKIFSKIRRKEIKLKPIFSKTDVDEEIDYDWEIPHSDLIAGVAWSPIRHLLATSCGDHVVRIFKINKDPTLLTNIFYNPGAVFTNISWSPDAKQVALAGEEIAIWDVQSGKYMRRFEYKELMPEYGKKRITPSTVAYTPYGRMLAASFHDGSNSKDYQSAILVWDFMTGKVRQTLTGHQGGVTRIAWSSDGQLLASTAMDCMLRIWDPEVGEEIAQYPLEVVELQDLAWSNRENKLAIRSWNDEVHIYQIGRNTQNNGKVLRVGHKVSCVTWSPRDDMVACGCTDGAIRLLSISSGTEVIKLDGHRGPVSVISWSSDDYFLASGGDDHNVRIWRVVHSDFSSWRLR
jgi:WD40 repeat protein